VSAATKATGRLTGNRRLRASDRYGQACDRSDRTVNDFPQPGPPVSPRGMQAEQGVSQGPFGLIERRQVDGGDLRCGLRLGGQRRRGHRLADHPSAAASSSRPGVIWSAGTSRIFAASAIRLGAGR
jgi:hypothetical protein